MKINVNLSNSFVCKIKSVGYDNKTFNPFKKSWINNSEETPGQLLKMFYTSLFRFIILKKEK